MFQEGPDEPLAYVPVRLTFADGSSLVKQTRKFGLVNFAGFDGSEGVTVTADLPHSYSGYALDLCITSRPNINLDGSVFDRFGFKFVHFGAEIGGEMAGP